MKLPFLMKKRQMVVGGIFVLSFFVAAYSVWIKPSKAVLQFGGQITSVFYCPCSANLAIVVGPPSPGVFMYQPGVSMVYAWYQIFRPGPWVLGTYTPGGACMMFIPYGCAPMAAPMGTITQVGTSL